MIQTGDEVEFDSGSGAAVRGTVTRVVTEGEVLDVLTNDSLLVVDVDDPVLILDTPDGETAVYASEAKVLPVGTPAGWAALVPLLAKFEAEHEDDPEVVPSGRSVKAVFERGLASWPGPEKTALSRDDWALGRTQAFLVVSAGGEIEGYAADRDLLPD